jgi:hypothetical protein
LATVGDEPWCVIGAGPAGIAVLQAMHAHGVRAEVLEAGRGVAGPTGVPTHRATCRAVAADLHGSGLAGSVRFGTDVLRADPRPDGGWVVTTTQGIGSYRGMVLAHGHRAAPWSPPVPARLGCQVLHAVDYRGPEQVEDRLVTLVRRSPGRSVLAAEIAAHARCTVLSGPARRGVRGWVRIDRPGRRPVLSRPPVVAAEGNVLHFADGSHARTDLVVVEGQDVDVPFLDHWLLRWDAGSPAFRSGVVHPGRRDLLAAGLTCAEIGVVRRQAVLVAQLAAAVQG